MKILFISDKVSRTFYGEGNRAFSKEISFVISCGDLPIYYLNYIIDSLDVPCFYVPGNHDGAFEKNPPQGWQNIQNRVIQHEGITIAGLGGCRWYNGQSPYQYTETQVYLDVLKLRMKLSMNKWLNKNLDILVAHSPAQGLGDITDSLTHSGFKSYRQILDKHQPKLFVYGHAHISYGAPRSLRYNNIDLYNAYSYQIIDWDSYATGATQTET